MESNKGRTDISHGRRDADLDTRVSFLCQLALEELVQFGVEDAVGDELPTLGNGGSWYGGHDGGAVEYGGGTGTLRCIWRIASGGYGCGRSSLRCQEIKLRVRVQEIM